MATTHTVTIKHDPESHAVDCHDECTATLTCPGVADSCRCWWECTTCYDATRDMGADDLDDFDDRLSEDEEAHGVEHQRIDSMWMTPTDRCVTHDLEHDAGYLVRELPDGDHAVELDCEEGFVHVIPIPTAKEATP